MTMRFLSTVMACSAMLQFAPAVAQTAKPSAASQPAQEMVQLNFPANTDVKVLVDYVSQRLGMNIIYGDGIGSKKITIASPAKVPKDSLLGLLQSVLRMADLALVDADQPGWKKIVQSRDLLSATGQFSKGTERLAVAEAAIPLTQIFELREMSPAGLEQHIKPFLSQPGGNSFSIPNSRQVVVTDYAANLRRIASLIELLDKPGPRASVELIEVVNLDATDLVRQVSGILAEQDRLTGNKERSYSLSVEPRSNKVILVSTQAAPDIVALLKMLDVPTTALTKSYRLRHVDPKRIDKLARDYLGVGPLAKSYKTTMDGESGLLLVSGSAAVHEQFASLIKELDVPGDPSTSHVRFYKILNTTAGSVISTINAMESSGQGLPSMPIASPVQISDNGGQFSGPNRPPAQLGQELPKPPTYPQDEQATSQPSTDQPPPMLVARTKDATVTADTNTNTVIVMAPPAVQETYRQLIEMLDKRRPQVMIEVTLVTLDTSESFSLGVELSRRDTFNGSEYVVFSSFGLSTINPATGLPTITPSTGLNGLLLSPDNVNVVIKALATNARAKVISAPKVLVNDNATATLSSIKEAPFVSINASETVSTTSFAGYASAGTTVTATPHISEGDHLQLQYAITLSSFSDGGGSGIPPPRQTNSVNSEVTIPDGFAVVIGGLTRDDISESQSKIPLLGDIPLIKYLFRSQTKSNSKSTLFVFVRPTVLRDDQFEDLKFLSDGDLEAAELDPNIPSSGPLIMDSTGAQVARD